MCSVLSHTPARGHCPTSDLGRCVPPARGAAPVPHAVVRHILHTTAPAMAHLPPGGPAASRTTPGVALGPSRRVQQARPPPPPGWVGGQTPRDAGTPLAWLSPLSEPQGRFEKQTHLPLRSLPTAQHASVPTRARARVRQGCMSGDPAAALTNPRPHASSRTGRGENKGKKSPWYFNIKGLCF